MTNLTLYEEVILLALCEERGTINSSYVNYAVAAAIVAELLLRERISIDEGRGKLINVESTALFADPILDEAIQLLSSAKRRKKLNSWVQKFSTIKNLRHKVAEQLVRKGIVKADTDKVLFLFTRKVYPELNPVPEKQLRERLRQAVLSEETEIETRTTVLLSLLKGARLIQQVFSRKELREHKKRIERITEGDLLGGATKELISACEAAIMVAVIIPAITVSTS